MCRGDDDDYNDNGGDGDLVAMVTIFIYGELPLVTSIYDFDDTCGDCYGGDAHISLHQHGLQLMRNSTADETGGFNKLK